MERSDTAGDGGPDGPGSETKDGDMECAGENEGGRAGRAWWENKGWRDAAGGVYPTEVFVLTWPGLACGDKLDAASPKLTPPLRLPILLRSAVPAAPCELLSAPPDEFEPVS